MIVDASALVALLTCEPGWEHIADAVTAHAYVAIGVPTLTETGIVLHSKGVPPKLTGYMPVVDEAVTLLEAEGWFDENPTYAAAFDQFTDTTPNQATAGALLGSFPSLRTTVEEALEAIHEGTATVEEALSQAKTEADADLAAYNSAVEP